jgi:hypothetical protein
MSIPKRSTLQKRQTAKLAEFRQKKSRKNIKVAGKAFSLGSIFFDFWWHSYCIRRHQKGKSSVRRPTQAAFGFRASCEEKTSRIDGAQGGASPHWQD